MWLNTLTKSLFFFQAEDGIRDLIVTGVQTCALPISFFIMRPAGVGSMGPDVTARSCRPQDAKAWRAHPAGPTLPHGFARFETAERCRDRPAARRRHRHRLEPLRHRARRRPRAVRRVRPG